MNYNTMVVEPRDRSIDLRQIYIDIDDALKGIAFTLTH